MSAFILFLITVVIITMSGALAPGPLFFTNLSNAHRWGWRGGIWLSLGHTLIEFPLVLIIAIGFSLFINNFLLQFVTAVLGGIVLLLFGIFQLRDGLKLRIETQKLESMSTGTPRHPLVTGLLFTGLNPYFLVWWLTAGATIVIAAWQFAALVGVLIMYFSHVWMDYAWLAGTAWLTNKGTNLVGTRGYMILTLIFAGILIYFGLTFIWSAVIISGILG